MSSTTLSGPGKAMKLWQHLSHCPGGWGSLAKGIGRNAETFCIRFDIWWAVAQGFGKSLFFKAKPFGDRLQVRRARASCDFHLPMIAINGVRYFIRSHVIMIDALGKLGGRAHMPTTCIQNRHS